MPLSFLSIGELSVPTGQIIACDPLIYFERALPFTRKVRPGKYPIIVCVAKTANSGDRYAVIKLEFSKSFATCWELALVDGQNIEDIKDKDEFFGFPVGAGLGCFMDLKATKFYVEIEDDLTKKDTTNNLYDDLLADEFKKNAVDPHNPIDAGDWLNFCLPNKPDMNIIMFHSGFGDGIYPSYWGIDEKGEICSLIVDFCVL